VVSVADLTLNHWSPNGELLLDREADVGPVVEQLAEAICRLPWPLVWFEMVPCEARRWILLTEALTRRGALVDVRPGFEIGRVSLQQPFDIYMSDRSKNLRRSVRKDLKRLEGDGKVELRLLDGLGAEEVEDALRRAFTLEDSGWKGAAGSSVLRNEGIFEFYLRQARHFAGRRILRLAFLECAGRPIAFELGWLGKAVYHSFKVGYDERYRKFGPGHLLRYKLIERGSADPDLQFVDYQGPITEALCPWATERYTIGRIAVSPARLTARVLWAGLQAGRKLSNTFRHAAAWLG
jgi:hypothetical protein